ncbi:MAG: SagB/ThcOx family dehydrogenase [Sulfuricaulis sp.]
MPARLEQIIAYHEATKHRFNGYAPGPDTLDWATQPDPFRRYADCEILALEKFPHADGPTCGRALIEGGVAPASLASETIARLFYDSLALSAWKQAGRTRWALRVNPSSGNLHPTESYLVSGPVAGLLDTPAVCHYAPSVHALENRVRFSSDTWRLLAAALPPQSLLIGLSSIYWREAWKYGSRAFRYCQHDTGHAIAALGFAAAALGWKVSLLDDVSDTTIAELLGLPRVYGPEVERPECLLAVYPSDQIYKSRPLPRAAIAAIAQGDWRGTPNELSPAHQLWPVIQQADEATAKPETVNLYPEIQYPAAGAPVFGESPVPLRRLIHQRRSAVTMDGSTGLPRAAFYSMLQRCLPGTRQFPGNALSWPAKVHLLLFVHRVSEVASGLYLLVRDPAQVADLRAAVTREFDWTSPEACPDELPLYRLVTGDCRQLAGRVSCHQEIAADGAFAVSMLAEFERPLAAYGPWFYRRLHWECGMIGQLLYLEAEANGIQATGIGCFFDDPVHEILGLKDRHYQSLYHFTLGGGVEDVRLTTLPAYSDAASLPADRT